MPHKILLTDILVKKRKNRLFEGILQVLKGLTKTFEFLYAEEKYLNNYSLKNEKSKVLHIEIQKSLLLKKITSKSVKKSILKMIKNSVSISIVCIGKGDPIGLKISGNTKFITLYNISKNQRNLKYHAIVDVL